MLAHIGQVGSLYGERREDLLGATPVEVRGGYFRFLSREAIRNEQSGLTPRHLEAGQNDFSTPPSGGGAVHERIEVKGDRSDSSTLLFGWGGRRATLPVMRGRCVPRRAAGECCFLPCRPVARSSGTQGRRFLGIDVMFAS